MFCFRARETISYYIHDLSFFFFLYFSQNPDHTQILSFIFFFPHTYDTKKKKKKLKKLKKLNYINITQQPSTDVIHSTNAKK